MNTRFIELAGEVNTAMPSWVVGKVEAALNERGLAVNGSNILLLGIAYKKDTSDTRESRVENHGYAQRQGCQCDLSRPHVSQIPALRDYDLTGESVSVEDETITSQDCILLCTDHANVDYDKFKRLSRLIVDTRGVFSPNLHNVVPA